jgi:hypothetical protein
MGGGTGGRACTAVSRDKNAGGADLLFNTFFLFFLIRRDDSSVFRVTLILTESGEEHLDRVLDLTFSFLALVGSHGSVVVRVVVVVSFSLEVHPVIETSSDHHPTPHGISFATCKHRQLPPPPTTNPISPSGAIFSSLPFRTQPVSSPVCS